MYMCIYVYMYNICNIYIYIVYVQDHFIYHICNYISINLVILTCSGNVGLSSEL